MPAGGVNFGIETEEGFEPTRRMSSKRALSLVDIEKDIFNFLVPFGTFSKYFHSDDVLPPLGSIVTPSVVDVTEIFLLDLKVRVSSPLIPFRLISAETVWFLSDLGTMTSGAVPPARLALYIVGLRILLPFSRQRFLLPF